MSDDTKKPEAQATEQTKGRTLQDVQGAFNQAIFNLGRRRYEMLLAEHNEREAGQKAADLAAEAAQLRQQIEAEVRAKAAAQPDPAAKPGLTVLPGGADAPKTNG